MPIHEYDCAQCGAEVERLELHTELPPVCCKHEMRKVVSLPGVAVLKGAGFYATEYGTQPQHLNPTDQARRAARECKEQKLTRARPGRTTPKQAKHIEDLEKYGG
jgi:putative FmdB family regulatory protein